MSEFAGVWGPSRGWQRLLKAESFHEFTDGVSRGRSDGLALDTFTVVEGESVPVEWVGALSTAGDLESELVVDLQWTEFRAKWRELNASDLRLSVLQTCGSGDHRRWAGLWRPGTDPHYLWVRAGWEEFRAKWAELGGLGLSLVSFTTYVEEGRRLWAGAWRSGSGRQYLWVNADWESFFSKWTELGEDGFRLISIASYIEGGRVLWAGAWTTGAGAQYLWAKASWDSFALKWRELQSTGLALAAIDGRAAVEPPHAALEVGLDVLVVDEPTISLDRMVRNAQDVFRSVGLHVIVNSVHDVNDAALMDLEVGSCVRGVITAEQRQLFTFAEERGKGGVIVSLVRSTVPPYNGCAVHPEGIPGVVVAGTATEWTLAHELGHVFGLEHVAGSDYLMTDGGTDNITNPPPDVSEGEAALLRRSPFVARR